MLCCVTDHLDDLHICIGISTYTLKPVLGYQPTVIIFKIESIQTQ